MDGDLPKPVELLSPEATRMYLERLDASLEFLDQPTPYQLDEEIVALYIAQKLRLQYRAASLTNMHALKKHLESAFYIAATRAGDYMEHVFETRVTPGAVRKGMQKRQSTDQEVDQSAA